MKTISELLEGQKTLFSLLSGKLEPAKAVRAGVPIVDGGGQTTETSSAPVLDPVSYATTAARALLGNTSIKRNLFGQPKPKRINSVVEEDHVFDQTDEEGWETSADEKRREKLRRRNEERRLQENIQKKKLEEQKKPKFVVGTGSRLDNKDRDCPGEAAPKHVFVARTAMSTTKETVEGCLEYLAGIKGVATCCTPQERIESGEAFSLSWRVQVDSGDLEKALLSSSWKTGWAVKQYFFRRKKPENQHNQRSDPLSQFLAQAGYPGNLRQKIHP